MWPLMYLAIRLGIQFVGRPRVTALPPWDSQLLTLCTAVHAMSYMHHQGCDGTSNTRLAVSPAGCTFVLM